MLLRNVRKMGGVKVGWEILGIKEVECRRAEGRGCFAAKQRTSSRIKYGLGQVCIGRLKLEADQCEGKRN